jgi:putative tricarboxylic transport membrane protein
VKLNDAVFGAIFLALGALVLFAIQGFPKIPGQPVGPALFPGILATVLCVTGVVLLVQGWLHRRGSGEPWLEWEPWVRSPRHVAALAVLLGSALLYLLAANALGFLVTATLILTALFIVLRVPPGRAVLIAVVAALVVHFAFYKLLRVPLPWGVLTSYAW